MLLTITNACTMGCLHCSEECTPTGKHMDMKIFKEALKFISRINPLCIVITGGEPTMHPEFETIVKELKKRFKKEQLVITSNGLFLEDLEKTERILKLGVTIQVTNDHRYYPKYVGNFNHPLIVYEREIRSIYPLGRAVTNGIESYGTKAPKCFNARSISKSASTLHEVVRTLEMNGKFCTPSIEIDGSIKAGEFRACTPVGTVKDNQITILDNIKKLKCNNCGMEDVLSPVHKHILHN